MTSGKYEQIGGEIGRLVDKKQRAYGRSSDRTGEIVQILYPAGITPSQYRDVLAIVRILDKVFRIATHAKDPKGENPWKDVAGYALLMNRELQEHTAESFESLYRSEPPPKAPELRPKQCTDEASFRSPFPD
jgi:hypothetical protein